MTVIAIVSETTKSEAVLQEAADRAAASNAEVHVVHLIGVGWVGRIEWWIADMLNIGGGLDTVRELAARRAAAVAEPALDEFTPVGLVGEPIEEIVEYAEKVDAECIVLDGDSKMAVGIATMSRDPVGDLAGHGFQVVAV